MKILLGVVLFLLGLFMLLSSLKAHESRINDLTQDRLKGVFDFYDQSVKQYPIIQKTAKLMDLTDRFKETSTENNAQENFFLNNLNIIVSVLFIVAGFLLTMSIWTTPLMIAVFAGIAIIAFFIFIRSARMNLN